MQQSDNEPRSAEASTAIRQALAVLTAEFWSWRRRTQPRSSDDIPRMDRPADWVPDWGPEAVGDMRRRKDEFLHRVEELVEQVGSGDRATAVDARLLLSAAERVHWELDVLQPWRTNPLFYVDQTVGVLFDLLVVPAPDAGRLSQVVAVLHGFPSTVAAARHNLDGCEDEFLRLALDSLARAAGDVREVVRHLTRLPDVGPALADDLHAGGAVAAGALTDLQSLLATIPTRPSVPVGHESFQWFLSRVALVPLTPDEIDAIGSLEVSRATALEAVHRGRADREGAPAPASRFATSSEQQDAAARAELEVRDFHRRAGLLDIPEDLAHYSTRPMPAYLAPIAWAGTADDLTSIERNGDHAWAYFPPPADDLPYFYLANAVDPRIGLAHEGCHHQQLALSRRHPRPARRFYYDSTPVEGIAFYNEELLLEAGLFDDTPRSREILANMMRLRAVRSRIDCGLATGSLTISGAAEVLRTRVPMDGASASTEAAFFASTPGQAMTYQVGKAEILRLLGDARAREPDGFDLQAFHDRLWREGNVPLSLQRWELLGDRSDLERCAELAPARPTRALTTQEA